MSGWLRASLPMREAIPRDARFYDKSQESGAFRSDTFNDTRLKILIETYWIHDILLDNVREISCFAARAIPRAYKKTFVLAAERGPRDRWLPIAIIFLDVDQLFARNREPSSFVSNSRRIEECRRKRG